jgi:hypothetical protein
MLKQSILGGLTAVALALAGLAATTHNDDGAPAQTDAAQTEVSAADKAIIADQAPSYPLDTCIITGKEFTADKPAVEFVVEGQLVRTCCARCEAKVKADPKATLEKVRAAVITQQKPLWPLSACPISGDAYGGEMGEPVDHVVGTRYVKLCCGGCKKAIDKDPKAFIEKLDKLVMPELAKTYPAKTCPVSGEALGSMGEPIDVMYGHRLVRFCCGGCLKAYRKDPAGVAAKVYAAPVGSTGK